MKKTDFQGAGRFDKRDKLLYLMDISANKIYKLCYQLTNNKFDADDLFQDTWVRVVRNFDYYDESKSFDTWIYTITINLYKDKYRKQKRWLNIVKDFFTNEKKDFELLNATEDKLDPQLHLVDKESIKELGKFLNSLSDTFRIPIILYYFKEMNYSEISRILDIPLGTVKSRLSRGIGKLKKMMEKGGYSYEN